ncbi:MAG TPA: hypothetical protein VGJ18_00140 [Gemmatimonadaceae bacterium]|jgi:hypothetical protein
MTDTNVVVDAPPTGNGAKPHRSASKNGAVKAAKKTARKRRGGKRGAKAAAKPARVQVSATDLPRKTLEQALRVAKAMRDVLAGGPASWAEIASAMKIGAGNQMNKYYLWSAVAYGLVNREDEQYTLTENGKKILAPTRPGEDKEALVRAVLTPVIFSRFFTDYNGSPFPGEEHIGNVLEVKYSVPRERVDEAKTLLMENGIFTGILRQEAGGSMVVRLDPSTTGIQAPPSPPAGQPSLADQRADGTQQQTSSPAAFDYSTMCFVVTPIGDEDSEERKHANLILKSVIELVVKELNLNARRADQIDRAGIITQQIFECLARARVCVADLSFTNPNAFYELGVRHMCKAPTVQIIRKGDPIPFDVSQGRTIKIDLTDVYSVPDSIESAKKELHQHLKHALSNEYKGEDNPVNTYLPLVTVNIPK